MREPEMTTFTLLIVVLACVVLLGTAVRLLVRWVLCRRRSIDGITDFLQQVHQYATDLEVDLVSQEELKAKWLNDVVCSEAGYRRAVLETIDRLREFFGRMRRNVITVKEFGYTALGDGDEINQQEAAEARQKLQELVHIVNEELQVLLEEFPGMRKMLREVLDESDEVLKALRRQRSKGVDSYAKLSSLLQSFDQVVVGMDLKESDKTIPLYEVVAGFEQFIDLLPVSDRAGNAVLHELTEACQEFLGVVWFPLLRLVIWSRVPLDRWTFIPVPEIASFGRFREVDILHAYQRVKMAMLAVTSQLYPGGKGVAERIDAKM
jgi:hypothetical protein